MAGSLRNAGSLRSGGTQGPAEGWALQKVSLNFARRRTAGMLAQTIPALTWRAAIATGSSVPCDQCRQIRAL